MPSQNRDSGGGEIKDDKMTEPSSPLKVQKTQTGLDGTLSPESPQRA